MKKAMAVLDAERREAMLYLCCNLPGGLGSELATGCHQSGQVNMTTLRAKPACLAI
jgi:hypothetical protein